MIGVISFAVDFSQRSEESTVPRALAHKTVDKAVNFGDHSLRQRSTELTPKSKAYGKE